MFIVITINLCPFGLGNNSLEIIKAKNLLNMYNNKLSITYKLNNYTYRKLRKCCFYITYGCNGQVDIFYFAGSES